MDKWQPIETAPKDGTWILLRGRKFTGGPMIPVVAAWTFGHGLGDPHCWRDNVHLSDLTNLVASPGGAEWMPLPEETDENLNELLKIIRGDTTLGSGINTYPNAPEEDKIKLHEACLELERRGLIYRANAWIFWKAKE